MFLIHLHTAHQNVILKELNSNPQGLSRFQTWLKAHPSLVKTGCEQTSACEIRNLIFPRIYTEQHLSLRISQNVVTSQPSVSFHLHSCHSLCLLQFRQCGKKNIRKSHSLYYSNQIGMIRNLRGRVCVQLFMYIFLMIVNS